MTAIERLGANVAQLSQVSPEVVDLVDTDEATRVVADALGVPAKVIRSAADVTSMRDQRAKAQQQPAPPVRPRGAQWAKDWRRDNEKTRATGRLQTPV